LNRCHGWFAADVDGLAMLLTVSVGITDKAGRVMGHGSFGLDDLWDLGILHNIKSIASFILPGDTFEQFKASFGHDQCKQQQHALFKASNAGFPLYIATGTHLQSTICTQASRIVNGRCEPCAACMLLAKPCNLKSIKQRIHRHRKLHQRLQEDSSISVLQDVNKKHLQSGHERQLSNIQRFGKQKKCTVIKNFGRLVERLGAHITRLLEQVECSWKQDDYPLFVQNFIKAHDTGMLDIHKRTVDQREENTGLLSQALADILGGISHSLMNGTTNGRILTKNEKLFYASLYNVKGPWAHNLVQGVMLGPHPDTTRKYRAALSEAFDPIWRDGGKPNVAAMKQVMLASGERYPGLASAPGVIAEDATSLWRKIEIERLDHKRKDNRQEVFFDALTVRVWGMNGCCTTEFLIHSVQDLQDLMAASTADDVGCHLYAWVWVPQVRHAPWFPIRIEITNNKFMRGQVFQWWRELDVACCGAGLNLIGHVGDGDARMRAASFYLMRELHNNTTYGTWLQERIVLDHPLMNFLGIAVTKEGLRKLAFQDPMHLLWRWRRHILSCKRAMHIGPGLYVNWRHLQGCPHLRGGDLKHSDKQNWGATQRIFSAATVAWLEAEMARDPANHCYTGTVTFVWWGFQLYSCWYADENVSPHLTITHAASVLNSMLYWRFWVDKRAKRKGLDGAIEHYTIKSNFMTRETFLDTIISCSTRILMFIQYRDDPELSKWMPVGSRVSSCFCEHMNQYIRNASTNTTAVTAYAAMNHCRHYTAQQVITADADFDQPESRRGITQQMREGGVPETLAQAGYYDTLTDSLIKDTLNAATHGSNTWLQDRCRLSEELSLENRREFFAAPCKHFPRMECFKTYVSPDSNNGAAVDGLEDDDWAWGAPDSRDDVDEESDVDNDPDTANDDVTKDEDTECLAMFQEVLSFHNQPLDPNSCAEHTWKSLSQLVSDFNRYSLGICLQQHRSLRFRITSLFEQHRDDTRHIDEWDFVSIASDIVALFEVSGVKMWRVGNVEGIRKLKKEPEPNTDLSTCESESFPAKVAVLDNKAAFFVRWYRPCTSDGTPTAGTDTLPHSCLWNAKGKCKDICTLHKEPSCNKCCLEPHDGRHFVLPMHMDMVVANEPVTEIAACIVIDTLQMVKCDTHLNVWMLACGNKELILKKFQEAGGLVPKPNSKPAVAKIPKPKAKRPRKSDAPIFHADNIAWHSRPILDLAGQRVHIYWEREKEWFGGVIDLNSSGNDRPQDVHEDSLVVIYDDDDEVWEQFGHQLGACVWGLAAALEHVVPEMSDDVADAVLVDEVHPQQSPSRVRKQMPAHANSVGKRPRCMPQPSFHSKNSVQQLRPVSHLAGKTVLIYSVTANEWFRGVVHSSLNEHDRPGDCHHDALLVGYDNGDQVWEQFGRDPGACDWGLAVHQEALSQVVEHLRHGNSKDEPEFMAGAPSRIGHSQKRLRQETNSQPAGTAKHSRVDPGISPVTTSLKESAAPHANPHPPLPDMLVGRRVRIYKCKFQMWFDAVVGVKHVKDADYFQVLFEDGSQEWLLFGGHPGACVWEFTAEEVALSLEPNATCPALDIQDVHWHTKHHSQLLGASIYIQSFDKTSWAKAIVMHCESNGQQILVQYSDGTKCMVHVGPAGHAWGLAPIHPALQATLNRKGTKRLDQYQQGNATDIIVSVSLNRDKRGFCTMQRFEMRCFAPGTWLNAAAMEVCTSVLCNTGTCRVVHQGFYQKLVGSSHRAGDHCNPVYSADLKKWFSNAGAMWLKDRILVIVNLQCHSTPDEPWQTAVGNHWVLATVDLKHRTFRYYDPMGQHNRQELHNEQMRQCTANLKMWLEAEHVLQHPWVSHHSGQADTICSPVQGNSFDCGVFTILAALCEALDIPLCTFPWGQQHAAIIRTQLAALILK
jgi:hypothetical protein